MDVSFNLIPLNIFDTIENVSYLHFLCILINYLREKIKTMALKASKDVFSKVAIIALVISQE